MAWLFNLKPKIEIENTDSQYLIRNTIYKFFSQVCWHQYIRQTIEGWDVLINKELIEENTEITQEAIQLLTLKLQEIKEVLPLERRLLLMRTKIWIEKSMADFSGMVYHPSAKWLKSHGYNPKKLKSIEITNIENFIKWESTQPWHVLHEFAHAYHHQIITYDFQPLIKAYQHAQEQCLYQAVPRNNGRITTSYALKNVREYFAELSEAYFGLNDFYPFTREQLKIYDIQGYCAVEAAWNIADID